MMVSKQEFCEALAGLCAPVTVVTTLANGRPAGATVSAIASLSLEPPLLSVALDRRSRLLPAVLGARCFGVNILSDAQEEVAMRFATRGVDRFDDACWELDDGMPRLLGAGGWLVCDVAEAVGGGDHMLLVGTVRRTASTKAAPLIYARRVYGTHSKFLAAVTPTETLTTAVR